MVIAHNMMALNAMNYFGNTNKSVKKSTEKLSSGFHINRAADDAAGLSISEKMRNQIRNLNQGTKNIEDGISFVQTADGALNEVHSMLHRMEELCVKAANDTNNQEDRDCIDEEVREIKQEIKKIFKKTEFNGKNIFNVPYIPTVEGQPNDLQVFTTDNNQYGGITINNIRYTWDELKDLTGQELFEDDGIHFLPGQYAFRTYDGEDVIFNTQKGQVPPYLSRRYQWSAKNDGIYINNVLACEWADMGMDIHNIHRGEYSFSFHGMDISFEVPEEDEGISFTDFKKNINNDGFNGGVSWSAADPYVTHERAVTIEDYKKTLIVDDDWKNRTDEQPYAFFMDTTEKGIFLYAKDKNGLLQRVNGLPDDPNNPDMKWADFKSILPGNYGEYPIVDWGTSVQRPISDASQITLDYDALYKYLEPTTGMYFTFKIADEAGLNQVTYSLSTTFKSTFIAPVKTEYDDKGGTLSATDKNKFSFHINDTDFAYNLQRDTGKSFENLNAEFNTDFSVNYNTTNGTVDFSYDVKDSSGTTLTTLKSSVNYNTFYSSICNGLGFDVNLKSTGNYGSSLKISIASDKFDTNGSDSKSTYVQKAITYLNELSLTTKQTDQPKINIALMSYGMNSQHTAFAGVIMNAPVKGMYIQSGANSGEDTYLEWRSLTLSTIGLGGASAKTRDKAVGTLGSISTALNIISGVRSRFGAYQNRLNYESANNQNYSENLTDSESKIRDTDMATEMTALAKFNILQQAAQSMLAQANQGTQGILGLLQ